MSYGTCAMLHFELLIAASATKSNLVPKSSVPWQRARTIESKQEA